MRPGRWLRRGATLLGLGAAGTALVITTRHVLETPQPLESILPGEGQIDRKHGGNLYYNVAGPRDAEPMVLLHDFYPGASNYEYRHIFPRFASEYRVYAPDWLGFGLSEHPNIAYTGEFYAAVLTGFLHDVVKRPAIVVGSGHAANIAVRAASDTPDLVTRVILISPDAMAGLALEPSVPQVLARAAQRVSLGVVPYAFLATRPVLRRLRDMRTLRLEGNLTSDETVEHLYASAHQFGGHHALLALLAGELDLPIQNALALLTPPALIVSGEDDPGHPREEMEDLAVLSPHTDLEILPGAGAAVAEDQPALFFDAVVRWLHSLGGAGERPGDETLESVTIETMILPGTEETTAPEDLGDYSFSSDPRRESTSGVVTTRHGASFDEPVGTLPVTPAEPQSGATDEQALELRTMPAQRTARVLRDTGPTATEAGTYADAEVILGQASEPTVQAGAHGAPTSASTAAASLVTSTPSQALASAEAPAQGSPTSVPVRTPEKGAPKADAEARTGEGPAFAERRDTSARQTQPRPRSRTNSRPRSASSGEVGGSGRATGTSGTSGTSGTNGTNGVKGTNGGSRGTPGSSGTRRSHRGHGEHQSRQHHQGQ